MKRTSRWLPDEDRCCLPSPRLYPNQVAGIVFNFSQTVIPEELVRATRELPRSPRRHRPASVGLTASFGERAAAS